MERKEVYVVIDSEREYQNNLPDSRSVMKGNLSQGDRMILIEECLDRARKAWYNEPGKSLSSVSEQFRKIAALCVQDAEQNGMPKRELQTI